MLENENENILKIGIIKKVSFEEKPHMIIDIGNEDIWLEGPYNYFEKGDYKPGIKIEFMARPIGTIAGDCDFGDIGYLDLYSAVHVRILND